MGNLPSQAILQQAESIRLATNLSLNIGPSLLTLNGVRRVVASYTVGYTRNHDDPNAPGRDSVHFRDSDGQVICSVEMLNGKIKSIHFE